jgi:hypothetical protein
MKIKKLKATDFPHKSFISTRKCKVPEATNTNFNILLNKVNELVDMYNKSDKTITVKKLSIKK